MKKILSKRTFFALLLVLAVLATNCVVLAEGEAVSRPTTMVELQRQAFLMSKCSDGITNGVRIYGEGFDGNDMNTGVSNKETLAKILGLSDNAAFLSGMKIEDDYCISNKLSVADEVEQADGSMLAVDGYAYAPLGGDLQFIDVDYEVEISNYSKMDYNSVTLINVGKVEFGGVTKEFNVKNGDFFVSVISNCEQGVLVSYSSETNRTMAKYDIEAGGHPYEVAPDFVGWFNRETGELLDTDTDINLKAFANKGVHAVEARFAVKGETFNASQLGDCNKDGIVNTADAVTLLKLASRSDFVSFADYAVFDYCCDGVVNTGDAVAVLKKCAAN